MIGITGGIASGKSTVSRFLKSLGYPVLDADALVAECVLLPDVKHELTLLFGSECYLPNGAYNRELVRSSILANPFLKSSLEEVLHPKVINQSNLLASDYKKKFGSAFLFYEASLIFEAQRESQFDGVVVVCAPPEIRKLRLKSRNGLVYNCLMTKNEKRPLL
jgi:dephospho-CoA kinase